MAAGATAANEIASAEQKEEEKECSQMEFKAGTKGRVEGELGGGFVEVVL